MALAAEALLETSKASVRGAGARPASGAINGGSGSRALLAQGRARAGSGPGHLSPLPGKGSGTRSGTATGTRNGTPIPAGTGSAHHGLRLGPQGPRQADAD